MAREIAARDSAGFERAVEQLRSACMKCHAAENVPYFTVQLPKARASVISPGD
ncbi:MAG: hypothetical protein HYY18_07130 [Planctomycetes bacterium]|nr:hypothetical protein [Planctomycetota bacterium]